MKDIFLVLAGFAGTLLMTFFMYLIGFLWGKRLDVIGFLGLFIFKGRNDSTPKGIILLAGTILHFLTGIIYAYVYSALWNADIGKPNFFFSIIFGIASGLFAILVWNILIFLNSNFLNIPVKAFTISLFFTHIIFSFVVFYTYLFLERYPLPLHQSLNCG
jgi:hypothetical protein